MVITEANPIMSFFFSFSPLLTCLFVLVSVYLLMKWVETKTYPWLMYALGVVVLAKVYVCFLHIYWLIHL
jgi:hypothetical protein